MNWIKTYQKGIEIVAKKNNDKKDVKGKKFRQPRGVTVVLGNSIAKDVKGCELTDDSNMVVRKSFRGDSTSQIEWHVKPTTEQNPKNIILHCGTNDINDDS